MNSYLHVDLDAFFASVEQLDNPELRGKPVIVGGRPEDRRSVVSTASYEARAFGVHSAMPTFQAYRLCPQGIFVHGRMHRYAELSHQIMNIFRDYSPDVDQMSIDEAFIDLTGTEKLFGPPEETARKIKARVKEETGLTVSVGLASTKYLAKIASGLSKPDGFYIIRPGTEESFMLKLPLNKVWGLGPKSLELIRSKGLNSTRDIYERDYESLEFLFGKNMASFLYNVVRGNEKESFSRESKSHSISAETTFPYDLTDIYTIETELLELAQGVFFRLLKEEGFSRYLNLQGYGTSTGAFPARGEANRIFVDRGNQKVARRETPTELLAGIESGEFSFDSAMLRKTTVLRGRWLRDAEGKPATFVLAAYAWNPFAAAVKSLLPFGLELLVFFLLLGVLLWLALRRSLLRPMKALNKALAASPVEVSAGEFDYSLRYRELQSLTSGYLLRRQMLSAAPESPPETGRADLNEAMESAHRKLLPLILDRNLDSVLELAESGKAAADPEKLTDALLALIREVLPYGNSHARLYLRTGEKEGFLLAEAEVGIKWQLRSGALASLWEGVYRLPGSGDAPGAKLRRASAALPGSFCAVRRTKKGLVLTLGMPRAEDQESAPVPRLYKTIRSAQPAKHLLPSF